MQDDLPDISQAQEQKKGFLVGPEWVSWRDHPKTQEFVKWIEQGLVGTSQDHWMNGSFSTWEACCTAQGGAFALKQLAESIKAIQLEVQPIKQEQENEE